MNRRHWEGTRRQLFALGCGAVSIACVGQRLRPSSEAARLRARPVVDPPTTPAAPGEHRLGLGKERDGVLYLPRELRTEVPLIVLLHGAGGGSGGISSRLGAFEIAEKHKLAVLATDSRGTSWDIVSGQFGPDVQFLDDALRQTFARVAVDPDCVAIGGFSDGASYALSLGLINGDLFTHVLAFSPGFLVAENTRGRPAIFVSHGTDDKILPIDATSRRLVPSLERRGYAVRYREFAGPHTVPPAIVTEALEWMQGEKKARPGSLAPDPVRSEDGCG